MKNKRILITGMAGSIGSELLTQLAPKNKICGLDINETGIFDLIEEYRLKGCNVSGRIGDIRNRNTVEDVFAWFRPQIVFHCAALKHVTPNEQFPEEAVDTNINGTFNVIRSAKNHNAQKLIYVSTDKVINSWSIMGVTKKLGELVTKNAGYVAVRFGNVLGSRGSVIPIWQKQIDENRPLTVTDERMERYMMTVQEACELLIYAAKVGKPGEVLVMDMGKRVNILSLAKEIISKNGRDVPIRMIGARPGEALDEKLMTPEEKQTAVKRGKFYVITGEL